METFVMLKRSEETLALFNSPNAFTLLSLIAYRARRTTAFNVHNLTVGQSLIGDYGSCGLTRQQYRTALSNLVKWQFVTIKSTNKGTIATIVGTKVYDINCELANHQLPLKQPTANHQTTTNKNVKKEKNANNTTGVGGFEEFWEAYPKKKSKQNAINWWKKNKPSQDLQLRMHSTLYTLKGSPEWLKDKGQFIPYPASWLNAGGWDDGVGDTQSSVEKKCQFCGDPSTVYIGGKGHRCSKAECRARFNLL